MFVLEDFKTGYCYFVETALFTETHMLEDAESIWMKAFRMSFSIDKIEEDPENRVAYDSACCLMNCIPSSKLREATEFLEETENGILKEGDLEIDLEICGSITGNPHDNFKVNLK